MSVVSVVLAVMVESEAKVALVPMVLTVRGQRDPPVQTVHGRVIQTMFPESGQRRGRHIPGYPVNGSMYLMHRLLLDLQFDPNIQDVIQLHLFPNYSIRLSSLRTPKASLSLILEHLMLLATSAKLTYLVETRLNNQIKR